MAGQAIDQAKGQARALRSLTPTHSISRKTDYKSYFGTDRVFMIRLSVTDLDLCKFVRAGDGVVISQGTAEPQSLTEVLVRQAGGLGALTIFLGGGSFSRTFAGNTGEYRFLGYGAVGDHRALIKSGAMEIIPAHVSTMPEMLGRSIPCDVALIQVSGPLADGRFSFSLASDYTIEAVERARVVIAELNSNAPETNCEMGLDPARIDVLVESDRPLLQMPRASIGERDRAIATQIAGFIDDRSTLQIGYGAVPEAIIATLADRKDLGLHTGVISDSIVDLIEKGVITNSHKEVLPGVSVTGALWGTDRLYKFVHRNPAILLSRITTTHAPETLAKLTRLVSINSAIEVDLTGQVNAEQVGTDYIGAIGGQVDFVRAGARAAHGCSIIALASAALAGTVSKIVARLDGPVTTARSDVDIIATEHGAVQLKGLSLRERIRRLIPLAGEQFREQLEREAYQIYGVC